MNLERFPDDLDTSQNRLESKTFEIQKLISEFEFRLLGYEWKSSGDSMSFTGNPLQGNEVIQKIMVMLHSFSKEIILIANIDKFSWARQKRRLSKKVNALLYKGLESPADNYQEVFQAFFELLTNIGYIIVSNNSQNFLKSYWNTDPETKEDRGGNKQDDKLY